MAPIHIRDSSFLASTVPRLCTDSKATEAVISTIVDHEVTLNDLKGIPPVASMTAFHSLSAPSIHIRDYVHRLASYTFSSTTCMIAAFYYVRTAVQREPKLAPSSLSVHRLLITALVLAAKFFDDVTYSMSYYAKVGGLSVKELAYLELKLLEILDFRLHISSAHFQTLENDLLELSNPDLKNITVEYRKKNRCASLDQPLYCEAHHPDDTVGLWVHHPCPNSHVLDSLIDVNTKCDDRQYYEEEEKQVQQRRRQQYMEEQSKLISFCSTTSSADDASESSESNNHGNSNGNRTYAQSNATRSKGQRAAHDEGSGPLVRYTSSTSTVTSEGSMSTEGGMCSDGGSEDAMMYTPNWNNCINISNSNGGGNYGRAAAVQPTPDVYCRFRGPISSQQWHSTHPHLNHSNNINNNNSHPQHSHHHYQHHSHGV